MFNQYILILVWIGFMALIQGSFYRQEYNELTGEWDWRVTGLFAFIAFFPIIWYAGHRGWDGVFDTGMYIRNFMAAPSQMADLPHYLDLMGKDRGFYSLTALINVFISSNYNIYLEIIALIQGLCIFCFFRKHAQDYVLALFLFVASTDYLSGMFNGIRQFMAVSIVYLAAPFLIKKHYLRYFVLVLLASTFHQTALIMIPIAIIVQGKAWNKKTLLFIGAMLVAITFVGTFTSILDSALQDTQYSNVVSDYTAWNDDGTNPVRVLIYSIPCMLSFFIRPSIREEINPIIHIGVNMSIMTAGLYVISMFTSGIFMGRLPIYCNLYSYLILPWELEKLFGIENKKNMVMIMCGCYLLYYYFVTHFQYGII